MFWSVRFLYLGFLFAWSINGKVIVFRQYSASKFMWRKTMLFFGLFLIHNRMMEKREIFGSRPLFGRTKSFHTPSTAVYVGFYINFVSMTCLIGSISPAMTKDDILVNILKQHIICNKVAYRLSNCQTNCTYRFNNIWTHFSRLYS